MNTHTHEIECTYTVATSTQVDCNSVGFFMLIYWTEDAQIHFIHVFVLRFKSFKYLQRLAFRQEQQKFCILGIFNLKMTMIPFWGENTFIPDTTLWLQQRNENMSYVIQYTYQLCKVLLCFWSTLKSLRRGSVLYFQALNPKDTAATCVYVHAYDPDPQPKVLCYCC